MAILLCFFLVTLVTLVSSIFLRKINVAKYNLPPSPPSLPIIGNLHHISRLPHRFYHKLSIKYGPVILLRLGFVPVVVVSSSEAAEAVLKTHDLECCNRPKTLGTGRLSYGFTDITFSPYIREEEVDLVVKKVSESALKQSPVDLSKTFFSLTAAITCRVALGQNFHDSGFIINQDRIEDLVTESTTTLGSFTFSDFFPGGPGRFLDSLFRTQKRINKVSEELDAFYQHVIDDHLKRRKSLDAPGDIVASLLDMIDKNYYFKLSVGNIKAVLMNVFLAGVDTGAITMIWAMTELVRNPKAMKRVQENIRATLGVKRERITEEDVGKVDYLKHVIKETFRLHPPVPFLVPRETMSHIKIQGYDIPPKTQIHINAWTIGRDPKRWTDPEDFIPERFENSSVDFRGQHFDLLPFGSGRRICPAMSLAIATVELGLMKLLYYFDWSMPDGMKGEDIDMEEIGTLTVVKKLPLQLVPLQRY